MTQNFDNPPAAILNRMKAPGDHRPGVWLGGVLQVKVTSYCDLDCKNCSVGVGLLKKAKRQFRMTPEQYRTALQSLKDYTGVIGCFGGNPTIHPQFEELCKIFREEVPNKIQRGLWSNRLFEHGKTCRETFGPYSNLNVHQAQEAWDEIKRDWPEVNPIPSGLTSPSMHGHIFGSMADLGISPDVMWEKVSHCFINQTWSAEITVVAGELRGYFCEIAATMAELTGDPSYGVPIVPGWWKKPMSEFAHQVRQYCTRCLVPLNGRKVDAAGTDPEGYTEAWAEVMAPLTVKGRALQQIKSLAEVAGSGSPATRYLPTGVMPSRLTQISW